MYENPTADRLVAIKSVPFAHFSVLGTWADEREPCKVCGWHWQTLVAPLLLQWEPSTDVIGDFSWDGPFGYTFVVKAHVAHALKAIQFECYFHPVEYVKPERKRKTVQFPDQGPRLFWVQCSTRLELDPAASGVKLESSCSACGDVRYTFRNNGILIPASAWSGQRLFRITTNGRSDATFVTQEGRRLIENAGLSNISFSEAGQIGD
jgi:hypothetical protein